MMVEKQDGRCNRDHYRTSLGTALLMALAAR